MVKKVNNVFELYKKMGIAPTWQTPAPNEQETVAAILKQMSEEEKEIIEGFNRCFNSSSIFRLLETIPPSEVTPPVAAHALRKIMELEDNNFPPAPETSERNTIRAVTRRPDTFLRIAFVSTLVDIVCRSKNPSVILDGLTSAMRDTFPGDNSLYKSRLLEELLDCVTEGLFSLPQLCQAVTILATFYPEDRKRSLEAADRLWFGLMDKGQKLGTGEALTPPLGEAVTPSLGEGVTPSLGEAVTALFAILPSLSKSRHIVFRLAEEKAIQNWQYLATSHVIEIFRVLTQLKYERVKPELLRTLSGWFTLNIHSLGEQELLAVIWGYHQLNYTDNSIVTALEKVIKMKGLQIKEADLISTICSYCLHHRIRCPAILEGVGHYFIERHTELEPHQVCWIGQVFGRLDYSPPGFKFWELMENYLEHNFVKFPPIDVINLLVSFIYIEKYPLNFTLKLFNHYFMDRLHSQSEELVVQSRSELKLFDSVMSLSCKGYKGPFLPKDNDNKGTKKDMRLVRLGRELQQPLATLVGGDKTRVSRKLSLPALPNHPLFLIDLLIAPSHATSLHRLGFNKNNNASCVAVLILSPEHYDRSGKHFVGAQVMKMRYLKLMNIRVMLVDMNKAYRMLMNPSELNNYLKEQYDKAMKNVQESK